jgi:hypothetical protein
MSLKQYSEYKKKLGKNFIGPEEINSSCGDILFFNDMDKIPIPHKLEEIDTNQILILAKPTLKNTKLLTIANLKFAIENSANYTQANFYNQDWYVNESFFNNNYLELEWHLIPKYLDDQNRGILPNFREAENLPSAILLTYVFFLYAIINGEILWPHDYLWCSDVDNENDQIYVGRYFDSKQIAKSGFSIHRHLSIKKNYTFFLYK